MTQRIVTGSVLIIILVTALALGGWGFSIPFMICAALSVYEVYRAFRISGDNPVEWPVYAAMILSLPLMTVKVGRTAVLLPITALAVLAVAAVVIFRPKPKLTDIMASLLPILGVMIPSLCMLAFFRAGSRALELYFLIMSFGIPLMGDTVAYFIGVIYGRTKLCVNVSPNKTVEGAVAGLLGSVAFAVVVHLIFRDSISIPLWHAPFLGLITGAVGQIGDLFASLIKRHCGVKDFGWIFPGHGGIMDRLDSVYWACVAVYIYMNWIM